MTRHAATRTTLAPLANAMGSGLGGLGSASWLPTACSNQSAHFQQIGSYQFHINISVENLWKICDPSVTPNAASLRPNPGSHAGLAHHSVDQEDDAEDDNRPEDFLRKINENHMFKRNIYVFFVIFLESEEEPKMLRKALTALPQAVLISYREGGAGVSVISTIGTQ